MKKKLAGSVKRLPAKALKSQSIRTRKTMPGKKPPAPPQKSTFREDPGFAQAVQNYEAAVKAMQEHKFEKAKTLLEKILAAGNRELMDRAFQGYVSASHLALTAEAAGQREEAMAFARRAWDEREPSFILWARHFPQYRTLHSDPRFAAILREMDEPGGRVYGGELRKN